MKKTRREFERLAAALNATAKVLGFPVYAHVEERPAYTGSDRMKDVVIIKRAGLRPWLIIEGSSRFFGPASCATFQVYHENDRENEVSNQCGMEETIKAILDVHVRKLVEDALAFTEFDETIAEPVTTESTPEQFAAEDKLRTESGEGTWEYGGTNSVGSIVLRFRAKKTRRMTLYRIGTDGRVFLTAKPSPQLVVAFDATRKPVVIYAKPGTHPATYYRVQALRKPPTVGKTIRAQASDEHGHFTDRHGTYEQFVVREIKPGEPPIFYLERL